jgi:pimeloyl-ACP methyl ester carboxylesterase
MSNTKLFLHGLESSSKGTKGRWFREHFPEMIIPDFSGDLENRMDQLEFLGQGLAELIIVGSSFGGLMATCYAMSHPEKCCRLILLAPALNFDFAPPKEKISINTMLVVGEDDTVTPPEQVIPLALESFSDLKIFRHDDDHLLGKTFFNLDWNKLLVVNTFAKNITN